MSIVEPVQYFQCGSYEVIETKLVREQTLADVWPSLVQDQKDGITTEMLKILAQVAEHCRHDKSARSDTETGPRWRQMDLVEPTSVQEFVRQIISRCLPSETARNCI